MLALTTDVLLCHLSFNKAGQAALADIRYPALRLSPRINNVSAAAARKVNWDQEQEGQMPAENIVEVHHLKKSVGQGHELSILTGVELVVKRGETIALVGEVGIG